MLNPWWLLVFKNDYARQIDQVKLGMFHVFLHAAKGTRQVPNWRKIISEQLGENLCCMFPTNALTSQLKNEKAAAPKSVVGGLT